MKTLLFLGILSLGITTQTAMASCRNCTVTLEIHKDDAQAFGAALNSHSAMPLLGCFENYSSDGNFMLLSIETDPSYAQANDLNSFDIAKHLTQMIGASGNWRIKRIKAEVDLSMTLAPQLVKVVEPISWPTACFSPRG
jgi:hypothetical protein